jgi:hypothetical protein
MEIDGPYEGSCGLDYGNYWLDYTLSNNFGELEWGDFLTQDVTARRFADFSVDESLFEYCEVEFRVQARFCNRLGVSHLDMSWVYDYMQCNDMQDIMVLT